MKSFEALNSFDISTALTQAKEFSDKLDQQKEMGETELVEFLWARKALLAGFRFLGPLARIDSIARNLQLFGDFSVDIALRSTSSRQCILLEFEDAKKDSIFKSTGNKSTTEWAARFNKGYNQIIDWKWKLSTVDHTSFKTTFGSEQVGYGFTLVLIIGRDQFMSGPDRERLDWRSTKASIDSCAVHCYTYDQLCSFLNEHFSEYRLIAQTASS